MPSLKDEILTKISEGTPLTERLHAADGVSADAARKVIESPPATPFNPGLEAIIRVLGRPVLLVQRDTFVLSADDTDTWKTRLTKARPALRKALLSVGRIELDNNPNFDWVGTGWVVHDDVMVTNRHVAAEFGRRDGDRFIFRTSVQGEMGARVDFKEEHKGKSTAEFRILEVLHIEDDPGPDMAFLRVDWGTTAATKRRKPIALAESTATGRSVAVIGYPAKDTRTRIPDDMDRIFGNVYNVKRLAPGEVTEVRDQEQLVTHDCTTLGGNSGSAVVDLDTGEAVALHFAGREKDRNFAVPAPTVRARLDELLGTAPAPRRSGTRTRKRTATRDEAGPTLASMRGRSGYAVDFLGSDVPHPKLSRSLSAALAPVADRDDGELKYTHYSVVMRSDRRLPFFTAVNIDGEQLFAFPRATDKWFLDPRLTDQGHQIGPELYTGNNLDRGHLVRRLDPARGATRKEAKQAELDTFFYTNSSPQHSGLNQRTWLSLEDYILSNSETRGLKVSVFSGPVLRPRDMEYRDVRLPKEYWKVVAMVNDETGALSATAYLLSQSDLLSDLEFAFGEFKTYQVPIADIEKKTGLSFGTLKECDPLGRVEGVAARRLSSGDDIVL